MSIIDTLSAGFATITRRPWLIFLSLFLDGYLWFGSRLSALPFIESAVNSFVLPKTQMNIATMEQQWATVREALLMMGRQVNFFSLMASGPVSVPSLLAGMPATNTSSSQIVIRDGVTFWGLAVLLTVVGLFLGCLYLGLLTQAVRDDRIEIGRWLRRVWVHWFRLLVVGIFLLLATIGLIVPALFLVALVSIVSPAAGTFVSTIFGLGLLWFGIWIAIHLFFVADAVILGESGPWSAVWNSFQIVARNFWLALGLIVLVNVISDGLFLIWTRLTTSAWGTTIAIIGNAYIGAGLAAATLIFYQERHKIWQEAIVASKEEDGQ
ncbi:MAG: hypothetical protein GXP41_04005 [Chloroflexi bacterium]|nr:hypothetical protein [Chloroflexota bacterium]